MKVTTGLSTRKNFSDCTFIKVKVTANNVLFGSFVAAEISGRDSVYCIKPLSVVPLQKVLFFSFLDHSAICFITAFCPEVPHSVL